MSQQSISQSQETTSAIMVHDKLETVLRQMNDIILGKEHVIRLALTCLIARGHLLIEDQPGVGKTTLAHALAKTLGLSYQRVQFTSDLLPADILGVSIYNRDDGAFKFHAGPIFSQVILADEVNRATPRTQSALLEAMEEHQVTIEGETRPLPSPFFVIATQNPSNQIGTFPLPESQLDRFLMRLELGYPDKEAERKLLLSKERRELLNEIEAVLNPAELNSLQKQVEKIHCSAAILNYLQDVLSFSRETTSISNGLSPRAGLAILRAAQAWALLERVEHVLPEHIQAILPSVIGHRLKSTESMANTSSDIARHLIEQVPIP